MVFSFPRVDGEGMMAREGKADEDVKILRNMWVATVAFEVTSHCNLTRYMVWRVRW